MPNPTIDPARIAEYETARRAIMNRYTPELKAMASEDPRRAAVWNERADALQDLAREYQAPAEGRA